MAEGIAKTLGTDIGVGITGNAGPAASEGKEVGLVYISVYFQGERITRRTVNTLGRDRVRNQAATNALDLIRRRLQNVL